MVHSLQLVIEFPSVDWDANRAQGYVWSHAAPCACGGWVQVLIHTFSGLESRFLQYTLRWHIIGIPCWRLPPKNVQPPTEMVLSLGLPLEMLKRFSVSIRGASATAQRGWGGDLNRTRGQRLGVGHGAAGAVRAYGAAEEYHHLQRCHQLCHLEDTKTPAF